MTTQLGAPRRERLPLAVLALAAALVAGCGQEPQRVTANAPTTDTAETHAWPVGVARIDPPVGANVRLHTVPTLTAQGPGNCHGTLNTMVIEAEDAIDVKVSIDTEAEPPYEGCELESRAVTISLAEMPNELRVRDSLGGVFTYIDGRLEQCPAGPQICNNAPAACDDATLHDAIANADVPAHFRMPVTRCEDPFAVVDVDHGAGACPQSGEPETNSCAGQAVQRMYWRIVAERWELIGYDENEGCGRIAEVAPDFPAHLCADLPAVRS